MTESPTEPTPQGNAKADPFQRVLLMASLLALFVSAAFASNFGVSYRTIFEQLGMTGDDLPVPTQLALAMANYSSILLPVLAGILIVAGVFFLYRGDAKTINRAMTVNWIVAAMIPGYVYMALHMPIIELQKKLGGGS